MTIPTPEEQADRVDEQQQRVNVLEGIASHAVTRLASGKTPWDEWLTHASRHGRHGFTNTLLIPAQRRTATDVRSYDAWRKTDRHVRRGETGIRVISARGKVRSLFDIEQTEGNAVDMPTATSADGFERLSRVATGLGLFVDRRQRWTYLGRPDQRIVLAPELDELSAASLLAHQLAHILQPGEQMDAVHGQPSGCHGARRVIADSVAYLLLTELGLPVSHLRFPPAESWAGADLRAAPDAAVRAVGERIVRTSAKLLRRLGEAPSKTPAAPSAAAEPGASETPHEGFLPAPQKATNQAREKLLAAVADAHRFYQRSLRGSWGADYLTSRGFSPAVQEQWEVGHAPGTYRSLLNHLRKLGHDDRTLIEAGLVRQKGDEKPFDMLRDRVLFPLRDQEGAVVGFIGRRQDGAKGPKYLNTPESALFKKSENLFGLHEVRGRLADAARPLLVEGPLDAIAVNTVMPQTYAAVAPCGTAITAAQLRSLTTTTGLEAHGLVLALDGDPAGRVGVLRAWRALQHVTHPVEVAVLPQGRDPADLMSSAARPSVVEALQSVVPLVDLVIDETVERFGGTLEFVESRLAAVRAAARLIADLPPAQIGRQVARVAARTRVETTEITAAVAAAVSPDSDPTPAAEDFPLPPLTDRDRTTRTTSARTGEQQRRSRSRSR
ncbi:toprim domain-containing protein [Actinomadura sp. WMMB 499]|uniref:toprim domain-containing protein n=1 Tax=Actinomadura sp. WMMB 499 TaxID=1219491 RepID=UPI001247B64A|nr:toprim domain-containing protein [Actinomadura sp. WMMB 499]QFG22892.1 toprim domain-containing protein [Actinomadura sp. WMMB 499]